MHIGKKIRIERIFNRLTGRTIIVPLDHGVTVGPIEGLVDMRETVNSIAEGGVDAVLMHKGLVRCGHREGGKDVGLIVHLSSSTSMSPTPNAKSLTSSVEDAIKHGADGVSVHVNLGDETERDMLADLGRVAAVAADWGMPLLAMMYARGPKIQNQFDPTVVAHCARVAVELGADIVKVPYTGDMDSFSRVVDSTCVPVVIAGGPKMDSTRDFIQMVHDSVRAGGAGLSVGRNIFQHKRTPQLVKALRGVVHEDWDVEQAIAIVGED
ncbi:2-amino-3,7-dideoxy-D-threo-hept-6-ulosonate synthase [Desulfovibrio psychrotolerans]|uniref:2-amino-3,7-dideoxy-D-threo-hept-6-ulosonate synthase n=1 Tax=Desulfovibrio psychrotolerans TaxID=415242 RepID=A0A7J0BVL9_9BACT|nr:2-amino-3,7-dideoxy-D-threo-hept-6-ulosonate synthase [Desulfovibrio psychrotolerans]GFM37757.1 2-amino-3,7-dideoxy-D-threo-hept-6-ulosonate synthase [Desulfovibrio psychrotolerans]